MLQPSAPRQYLMSLIQIQLGALLRAQVRDWVRLRVLARLRVRPWVCSASAGKQFVFLTGGGTTSCSVSGSASGSASSSGSGSRANAERLRFGFGSTLRPVLVNMFAPTGEGVQVRDRLRARLRVLLGRTLANIFLPREAEGGTTSGSGSASGLASGPLRVWTFANSRKTCFLSGAGSRYDFGFGWGSLFLAGGSAGGC